MMCAMGHTPLSPAKNRVRRNWLERVPRKQTIITISHGLLDEAQSRRHTGLILPCDIDSGTREVIKHASKRYPELRILPPGKDIHSTVNEYLKFHSGGVRKLGAVDLDLTASVKEVWNTSKPVIDSLKENKYHGKVLITFRNGRDSFGKNSLLERIQWLLGQLPTGVVITHHESYTSDHYDRFGRYNKGSAMCTVELQF